MVCMADTAGVCVGGERAAVPGEPSQGRIGEALESTCCRRRQLQAEAARSTVGPHGPRVHTLATTTGRAGSRDGRRRPNAGLLGAALPPCVRNGEVRRRAVRRTGANVRGGCCCCNGSSGYDGRSSGRRAVGGARKHAQWGLRRWRDLPGKRVGFKYSVEWFQG